MAGMSDYMMSDYVVFDADNHLYETREAFTKFLPDRYKGVVDYVDVRCAFLKHRGISAGGAVLVRPDRYVGFRSADAVEDPLGTLTAAVAQILSTTTT